MAQFYIAQILSIIAGVCMVLSLAKENTEEEQKLQTLDCVANALADVLLFGWVGAVLCLAGILRNNQEKFEERFQLQVNPLFISSVTWVIAFVVGIITNDFVIVVLFEVAYTLSLGKITKSQSRMLLAVDLLCWFIYDVSIQSMGMAIVDLFVFGRMIYCIYTNAPEENIVKMSIKGSDTSKPIDFLAGLKNAANELVGDKENSEGEGQNSLPEGEDVIDFSIGGQSDDGPVSSTGQEDSTSKTKEPEKKKKTVDTKKPEESKKKSAVASRIDDELKKMADNSKSELSSIDPIDGSTKEPIPTDLSSYEDFNLESLFKNVTEGDK